MLSASLQVCRHIDINLFITKSNCSAQRQQQFKPACRISGLFFQFSCRSNLRRFLRPVQSACRNLKSFSVQRISVLSDHQKLSVVLHSNHRRRAFMLDIIPFGNIAVGDPDGILIIIYNGAFMHQFPVDTLVFLHTHLADTHNSVILYYII